MNFYQFNKLLKNTCVSHKLVNEFQNGDIYTNLNSGQHKYPCLNLTVQTLNDVNDSITNCSFTLFYVDRLLDNNANTLEIQSNGLTILKQIAVSLDEDYNVSFKSKTFTPFTEKFSDLCAGVYMTATIAIESDVQCDSDTFDGKVITLSQNGIYDIIGYEKAIVNVIPKWGTIEGDINEQKDLQYQLSKKQDKLIAGDNIKIEDDVISADLSTVEGMIEDVADEVDELIERVSGDEDRITSCEERIGTLEDEVSTIDDITIQTIVPTTTNFSTGEKYTIHTAIERVVNLFAGYWNHIQNNIMALIPNQASTTNQLADKTFVNETVAQNAANFRGNWNDWASVPTDSELYPADYTGNKVPTNNDYLVVTDATGYAEELTGSWRFLYVGDWDELGKSGWSPAYRIGSAFTSDQQKAIDSGITSDKVAAYDGYETRIDAVETNKVEKIYTAYKIYGTDSQGYQTEYTAEGDISLKDGKITLSDDLRKEIEKIKLLAYAGL